MKGNNNFLNFENRTIIVAGASSGIGRQTAITLSERGARIIMIARDEEKLGPAIRLLKGEGHSYYCCDLSEIDKIEDLIKTIVAEHGKIGGLVYAAGIAMSLPLAQFKPEKLQKVFDINFFGFVEIVRQICKKGRYSEGMRIVGISSVASVCGDKAHLGYSSSKAAMNSAVRCIAKEVADKGICINTVAPSMVETEMYQYYKENTGSVGAAKEEALQRQYLGLGKTTDIANAITFLLSAEARFITGITLPIDGGYTTN